MTLRTDLQNLIRKQQPATARAFTAAIQDISDQTVIRRITEALQRGDIDAAIRALNIDRAAFQALHANITTTYAQAGATVVNATTWRLPTGAKAVVRWDMANPVAERFISTLANNITGDLSQSVINGVRSTIGSGFAAGRGPNSIALDIVGRIGVNGRRVGGSLGLNVPQTNHVASMRARLRSGDPDELRKVLKMTKRDRWFDGFIKRAIRDGRAVSVADTNKLTGRYSDRLLKLRGDTIARTETARAVEAGRMDAFRQGMDKSDIPPQAVYRQWLHGGAAPHGERLDHAALHRRKIAGLDAPWIVGGASMMHPLDTSMGAGAEHVANCRCMQNIRIDYGYLNRNG